MNLLTELAIPTQPIAQPRQKFRVVTSGQMVLCSDCRTPRSKGTRCNRCGGTKRLRYGGRSFVQAYQDSKHAVHAYKRHIRAVCARTYRKPVVLGPMTVDRVYVFKRPQRLLTRRSPAERVAHDRKPDLDNLDKAVFDALSGLLWNDDRQICGGSHEKWYAAKDETAAVYVTVRVPGEGET